MRFFGNGWDALKRLEAMARAQRYVEKGLNKVAAKAKDDIQKNINSGGAHAGQAFKPNAPITIHLKKSSRPWVDTGTHLRSIEIKTAKNQRSVGWDGELGVQAEIVEGGAVVPVTPQMRRWFAAQGTPLASGTNKLFIPGRPNLTALGKKYLSSDELTKIMKEAVRAEVSINVGN